MELLSLENLGLVGVALMGISGWFGRKLETAGTRAIAAQGAASDEWRELATAYRTRAEEAEHRLAEERGRHAQEVVELHQQIRGLEGRLDEAGHVVRAPTPGLRR